jgi:D-3-phosphoglycerate dehydrogenase
MYRILVADALEPAVLGQLKADGHIVDYDPSLTSSGLAKSISDSAILVVRSTKVTPEVFAAGKKLVLVIRAGAGVDTIDVASATANAVYVCNTPGCNSDAVAELAIGHLIACDRQIVNNSEALRQGRWVKRHYLNCPGLHGRTLGVLGAGAIAQRVIRVAQAMGMRIVCCAPELDEALALRLGVEIAVDRFDLARRSDAISVHIPLLRQTFHSCGAEFFEAMRPGAIFVNTSRGEIVDTEALIAAIKAKGIRAGLDVFEDEPSAGSAPFAGTELAKLLSSCTCHIGGSTAQASEAVGAETVAIVRKFVETGEALHCVNPEAPLQRCMKNKLLVGEQVGKAEQPDRVVVGAAGPSA